MSRYVCIHGHFYQPPRENPWLSAIEKQDSAHPYHDWNHRITAECYAPNANARILDASDYIVNVTNNYARTSFNVGPTLLSWMETEQPATYRQIIAADAESAERFGGHGSAIAQVYNHMIMPLANARDRATQVRWGIRDFEHRFNRKPQGMWLAETAANLESLQDLADQGIEFTILAPRQCARTRSGGGHWQHVGGAVDTRIPYWVNLPNGNRIAVFFYDGPISQGIAFERLLARGETFAERLTTAFADDHQPQLVHVATDGETYGHHHKYGEMALAYALHHIERTGTARVTNYSEFLALHPPTAEAEIVENSSWSCVHGVERWRADCGCRADESRGWSQAWRRPLREALDWLRDQLETIYLEAAPLSDPWKARDEYINVVLDRGRESLDDFFAAHGRLKDEPVSEDARDDRRRLALSMLEMQRNAMLMYTSCGWFFDELSGIETTQIIRYAARAIQLAGPYSSSLESEFVDRLALAKSNIADVGDGARIYAEWVKPAMVELPGLVAHYAVSSIFESYAKRETVYAHTFDEIDRHVSRSGKRKLAVGKVRCQSLVTRESATLSYAVLHLGEQALTGGVRAFRGDADYDEMRAKVGDSFESGDIPALMRMLDGYFLDMTYSLRSLLGDQQRSIASSLLRSAIDNVTDVSLRLHTEHASVIRYVASLGLPLPQMVRGAAEFVLNGNLRDALEADVPDAARVRELLREAHALQARLDSDDLAAALEATLRRLAADLAAEPRSLFKLQALADATTLIGEVPLELALFRVQTTVFSVAKTTRREIVAEVANPTNQNAESNADNNTENNADNNADNNTWLETFATIAEKLRIRLE